MDELKPGWLNRQLEKTKEDIKQWPEWMRREAGLESTENSNNPKLTASDGSDRKREDPGN
ncbi:MAG TPA: hypothetical protein VI756_08250 [Blastocatellia bacterium]